MNNAVFENFFNNTIEGIIIIEDGFIFDLNKAMLEILKYKSKNDLQGKLATGILLPNINQKFLEYNNATFEEISLITKNGDIIPAIIKIKDFVNENKTYKMVFILNLTDLKEKETLLLEQSRMAAMGEMIAMIAHQWRQPLSSIAAAISTLKLRIKMNKYDSNVFDNKITDIDKYLHYMSGTIDDFRNFFRGNKEKELVSLNYIVYIALEMIEKAFQNNNIEIKNSTTKLSSIYVYQNEVLQVILNILNNSKDALKEKDINSKAIVTIDYEDNENCQKLIISDNAGGIPENIIDNIFDPYFSTKDKKNGTGLGLYMCKTIIEKHCNGNIKAYNKNNGACFEIKIKK